MGRCGEVWKTGGAGAAEASLAVGGVCCCEAVLDSALPRVLLRLACLLLSMAAVGGGSTCC